MSAEKSRHLCTFTRWHLTPPDRGSSPGHGVCAALVMTEDSPPGNASRTGCFPQLYVRSLQAYVGEDTRLPCSSIFPETKNKTHVDCDLESLFNSELCTMLGTGRAVS